MVNASQQPAAGHFVLDVIDAFERGSAAGAVGHPQENASDCLRREREDENAAGDIPEARAAENALEERIVHEAAVAGSMIEPIEEVADHVGHWSRVIGHLSLEEAVFPLANDK